MLDFPVGWKGDDAGTSITEREEGEEDNSSRDFVGDARELRLTICVACVWYGEQGTVSLASSSASSPRLGPLVGDVPNAELPTGGEELRLKWITMACVLCGGRTELMAKRRVKRANKVEEERRRGLFKVEEKSQGVAWTRIY